LEVRKALHAHLAENGMRDAKNAIKRLVGGSRPGVSNDTAVLDAILRDGAFLPNVHQDECRLAIDLNIPKL
jgi:hypothetical protein